MKVLGDKINFVKSENVAICQLSVKIESTCIPLNDNSGLEDLVL
jgi:hypothetical protein